MPTIVRFYRGSRRLLTILALAAAAFANGSASAITLEEARANGVRIGYQNEPPYSFPGPDGKPTGTENELVLRVLGQMGITKVDSVITEFASLIPGLQANRFDVVPSMMIRPQRCEIVNFSEPLWKSGNALLVAKGNPKNLHSYEDAAAGGAMVGVMAGTVTVDDLKKAGVAEDKLQVLPDPPSLLASLQAGRVDAVASTPESIQAMADSSPDSVERASPFKSSEFTVAYAASVFRFEDVAFRDEYNKALKELMATPDFLDVLKPWGYSEDNFPGAMTATEQCSKPQ